MRMNKRTLAAIVTVWWLPLLMAGTASAQWIESKSNWQGRLTDAGGLPITTPVTMKFRLFLVPVGGNAVDSFSTSVTPDPQGFVTIGGISLGRPAPPPPPPGPIVPDTLDEWMELVANGTVLTPRVELHPARHSMSARELHGGYVQSRGPWLSLYTDTTVAARPAIVMGVSGDTRTFAMYGGFGDTALYAKQDPTNGCRVGINIGDPSASLDVDASTIPGTRAAEFRNNHGAAGVAAATVTIENTNAAGIALNATANSSDAAIVINNTASNGVLLKAFGPGFNVMFRVNSNGTVGIGTDAPNSALQVKGPVSTAYASIAVTDSLDATHSVVKTTNAGAITITLPSAVGATGREITIKRGGAGSVSVAAWAGQTIDGAASYSLTAMWKYVTVVSDGANWLITGNN